MGKKRKSGAPSKGKTLADATYNGNSKFHPDEQFSDSADEFQTGKDRILLEEGPEAKRRRKVAEDEELLQLSDEEIHPYRDETDEEDEFDEEAYEEEAMENIDPEPSAKRGRDLSPLSEDGKAAQGDEDDAGGWGASKKDYYDADAIETEGDALEEEAEAKKIQQKRLQSMDEEDFGLDPADIFAKEIEEETKRERMLLDTPVDQLPEHMVPMRNLADSYPEIKPLAMLYGRLFQEFSALAQTRKFGHDLEPETRSRMCKLAVVIQFICMLCVYFVVVVSTASLVEEIEESDESDETDDKTENNDTKPCLPYPPSKLRDHPVMDALVKCKSQWEQIKAITEAESSAFADSDSSVGSFDEMVAPIIKQAQSKILKPSENKLSRMQAAANKAEKDSELRRAERLRQTEAGLKDLTRELESYEFENVKRRRGKFTTTEDDSDFGDETTLDAHEAAEKARKKKSLRFYTSQIAQKANKRGAAGREAGGDADIPHRERLKDRQARLNQEAEKRGRREADEHERLGGESDVEDYIAAKEIRGGASDSQDYYDQIVKRRNDKNENKRKLAELYNDDEGGHVEEEIGPDGKRGVTYAIEKNKGLAPKRNKDARNPRVKKRKMFEKKKKKLGSVRQIYKGGESAGGYGGELTGIKKNLVKSVKL